MKNYNLTDWLPTTKKLESQGLKVAIVPQPNWRDDLRDFKKLGRPRLFFGVSAGCMDSMVNKYTANKRLRSEDAYTPDGRHDMRPEYPSIVYTQILKQLYPDVQVVLGGIEASLRRLTHYDYWQDKVRPSILLDSGADLLIYGMGEKPITDLCQRLKETNQLPKDLPQTAYLCLANEFQPQEGDLQLHSHEDCLKDKRKQAENFRHIEEEEQVSGCTYLPANRKTGSSSQSALSAHESGRTGHVVRPALHTSASSQIQEQTYSGI